MANINPSETRFLSHMIKGSSGEGALVASHYAATWPQDHMSSLSKYSMAIGNQDATIFIKVIPEAWLQFAGEGRGFTENST